MTQKKNDDKPSLIVRILRIYAISAVFMFAIGAVAGAALAILNVNP